MYISCPLCGLNSHLNRFKPEELQEIIELIEMRSQGRAKGWKVVDRFSALDDDELMEKIANRCRVILKIIGEEVMEKSAAAALVNRLREEIVDLEKSVEENENEVGAWRAESEELVTRINVAYNTNYKELDDAIDFLLEVALED
ncbi:hypothetical protein ES703_20551 [subsurface metagenome]